MFPNLELLLQELNVVVNFASARISTKQNPREYEFVDRSLNTKAANKGG